MDAGVDEVVITTGAFADVLVKYVQGLDLPLKITFVHNDKFKDTNYIYSIFKAKEYLQDTDLILMHGDLVFENSVFDQLMAAEGSVMAVSSTEALPQKDFKAVVVDDKIQKVGIEFFEKAMVAQPLYKLTKEDWGTWLTKIVAFCETGNTSCYAENALNEVSGSCAIRPLDISDAYLWYRHGASYHCSK
ncbi:phosphoenolpyruvate phosphomutase [Selenomonas sp. GACV-9]|uniref:DUF6564 domain-containing protein n=1 Tax=Selenomonas sp. GACV-9 TaxID=3158782 RepID=UPI0008E30E00|nr:phosphoenolpyruvate phosphomutase [Selenomonas ruminantium]